MSNDLNTAEKPDLQWLETQHLYVDSSYQRSTESRASSKNLEYLSNNFSWNHCGALIVSHVTETGKYAVLDGQHRLAAARNCNIKELPCVIIKSPDIKAQAASFVTINTKRVNINSLAKFHAALAAGDEGSISLQEILSECGLEIPRHAILKGETQPNQVQAVGTLIKLLDKYSRNQIVTALKVIYEAFKDESGALRAGLIKATVEFVKQNPEADSESLVLMLQQIDPAELEKDAKSHVKITGGTTVEAMIIALGRKFKSNGRKANSQKFEPDYSNDETAPEASPAPVKKANSKGTNYRLIDTLDYTGLSAQELFNLVKAKKFPQPTNQDKKPLWDSEEVKGWFKTFSRSGGDINAKYAGEVSEAWDF